jgi:hypothetical protein
LDYEKRHREIVGEIVQILGWRNNFKVATMSKEQIKKIL